VRAVLAIILFLFEPFLAAGLLLRIGPTLFQRDAATFVGFAVRMALALTSVAAASGLRASRPYADRLALAVLASSAAFAIIQYFTRVLPTSVPPDLAPLLTGLIVVHHAVWMSVLVFARRR
jgi:hypothetical protein